jgi:hypothetical protein
VHTITRCEEAIEGRRSTTALEVSEDRDAHFVTDVLCDELARQAFAGTTQPGWLSAQ